MFFADGEIHLITSFFFFLQANVVEVSRQFAEAEDEQRASQLQFLLEKAEEKNLELHSAVQYDGDCLFHSVLKLLPDPSTLQCLDSTSLRRTLVKYFESDACADELKCLTIEEFINHLRQPYRDVEDDLTVDGLAELTKKTVRVLTLDPEDGTTTEKTYKPSFPTGEIYIGHIKDKHFAPLKIETPVPLQTKEPQTVPRKRKSQASLGSFFVKQTRTETENLPCGTNPIPCTRADEPGVRNTENQSHTPSPSTAVGNEKTASDRNFGSRQPSSPIMRDKPHQPSDFAFPKRTFGLKIPELRSFQPVRFTRWSWLDYDEDGDKVFCFVCKKAFSENKLCSSKLEDTYITRGYTNWKDATSQKGFSKHEKSESHKQAVQRLLTLPEETKDVSESLSEMNAAKKSTNRRCLIKILETRTCLERGWCQDQFKLHATVRPLFIRQP